MRAGPGVRAPMRSIVTLQVRMLYVGRLTPAHARRFRHMMHARLEAGRGLGEVASVANGIPVWEATRRDQTARVSWHASDTRREFAFSYVCGRPHKQGHTHTRPTSFQVWTRGSVQSTWFLSAGTASDRPVGRPFRTCCVAFPHIHANLLLFASLAVASVFRNSYTAPYS